MTLGHEKLDVCRFSIDYIAWVYEKAGRLNGVHRAGRAQWLRASQSIPLNITEGNGKNDFDPDSDFDLDKEQPQPSAPGDSCLL